MTSPEQREKRSTIVLVDDHVLFRQGLREIFQLEDDLVVIGDAGDAKGALDIVRRRPPDVIILDVGIPGDDVRRTVAVLRQAIPLTKIIILSMFDEPALITNVLAAGVSAYLLKTASREELIAAVRGVLTHDRLLLNISRDSFERVTGASPMVLSPRETEILQLVAEAYSNAQIAHRLHIAEGTVKRHLRNIFAKLGAVSRLDAVNKALSLHILATSHAGRAINSTDASKEA
ncbi:MAG: response regulator [Frankiaceae bacterium]